VSVFVCMCSYVCVCAVHLVFAFVCCTWVLEYVAGSCALIHVFTLQMKSCRKLMPLNWMYSIYRVDLLFPGDPDRLWATPPWPPRILLFIPVPARNVQTWYSIIYYIPLSARASSLLRVPQVRYRNNILIIYIIMVMVLLRVCMYGTASVVPQVYRKCCVHVPARSYSQMVLCFPTSTCAVLEIGQDYKCTLYLQYFW
jgi:hypothetical protein